MDERSIIGDKGEKLSGHEAEAYALDASKRKEDAQVERDLLAAMTGANIEETRGRQNRGRAQKGEDERSRKDKEEFESAVRALLQQVRERLERINEEIAELNRKIRELEKDAAELAWARIQLENGESLETVLRDKEILRKLEEYQNRTGRTLDLNDRESVREALRMEEEYREQKADEYRERVRELEKEKAEIEMTLGEMEQSDVPQEQALKRAKEILARETPTGVQSVWRDTEVSAEVRQAAATVNTEDGLGLQSQQAGIAFPGFSGASVSGNGEFGDGIEAKVDRIQEVFANAASANHQDKHASVTVSAPTGLEGPKLQG